MAKKKRKWKGTPAQRAALKKGQRALAKWRETHGNPKRRKKKVAKRTKKMKRCVRKIAKRGGVRSPKKVCAKAIFHGKKKRRRNPPNGYTIKRGANYFDGAGFTRKENHAVIFQSQAKAKAIGQKIADKLGQQVAVVPNGH